MAHDARYVWFNDGKDDCYALVLAEGEGTELDLLVFDASTGAPEHKRGVPRREPPYGDDGGGHTWHG